jgi:hypothetical protein
MIYERVDATKSLTQGDIIEECPLVYLEMSPDESGVLVPRQVASSERVVVLTQACDLVNTRASKVQVALVHEATRLVNAGILKGQTIRDQVRRHQVFGWYFLPAAHDMPEFLIDLRDIHTVPRELLEQLVQAGHRHVTVTTPFREHLAQHFAVTYSRIALPEQYPTT